AEHVAEAETGGLQDRFHVPEYLPRLRYHVVAADEAALRVQRRHPGNEEEVVETDRVGVVADRGVQSLDPNLTPHGLLSLEIGRGKAGTGNRRAWRLRQGIKPLCIRAD